MKKFWAILSIVIVALVIIPIATQCKKEPKELKIGCITPLTGDGASYGRQTKQGVDLAVKELNAKNGINGKKIVMKYEDDQMTPLGGTAAIQKLITSDRVPVIIGGFTSTVTLAIAPIAEKNRIVLISASSTADDIKNSGDYIFRNVPTNSAQGKSMADFTTNKLKAKSAAILYMNNDYGITLKNSVQKHFVENGGKITTVEFYNPGDKDFRAQLSKIQTEKPDVIFYPGLYQESGLILKQARELKLKAVFIGGDGSIAPELIQIAGKAAEGSFYTNMAIGYGVTDTEINKFLAAFKTEYGEEPSVYSSYAYDAANLLADAIKRDGYSAEGIKAALYHTKDFRGVTGITNFDSYGEVDKPFYIYEVKGGKFELLK
jgi:branched-chain amino acid transport system substrate-binding protein